MTSVPALRSQITLADGRVLSFVQKITLPDTLNGGSAFKADDGLAVISSTDLTPRWGALLHVSMSYPDRDPDWTTIKLVRDAFFGDVDCMMVLPKSRDWVNVHDHTFHLTKTPERWGLR